MAKSANAEGGTNGVTVTTSDVGSGDAFAVVSTGAAGVVQYTTATAANGSLAYRLASRGTSETVFVAWDNGTAAATWYGRIYFTIDVLSGSTHLIAFRQSSGGGNIGYLLFDNPSRFISIRRGSDLATSAVGSNALTLGTWYRIEWLATAGGATGTITYNLYQGNSATLIETVTASGASATPLNQSSSFTTWQYVRMGPALTSNANLPSSTGFLYLDDMRAFDTGYPGAAVSTSQFARPSSDVTTAGWTPSTGASLFGTLDETSPDDADYVSSPSSRLWTPAPRRVIRPHDDLPRRRRTVVPCR